MYPSARQAFGEGGFVWASNDFRVVLCSAGYVYSDAHDFLNDILVGNRVAVSSALTGKTNVAGVFDAADPTIPLVSGLTITSIVLYKHTGTDATAALVHYWDQTAASVPISVVPDGSGIRVRWSNGPLKMFRI